jgi:hypothetical protein
MEIIGRPGPSGFSLFALDLAPGSLIIPAKSPSEAGGVLEGIGDGYRKTCKCEFLSFFGPGFLKERM